MVVNNYLVWIIITVGQGHSLSNESRQAYPTCAYRLHPTSHKIVNLFKHYNFVLFCFCNLIVILRDELSLFHYQKAGWTCLVEIK